MTAPVPLRALLAAAALIVLAAPPAAAQRYVAFGDSITEGTGDDDTLPEDERGYPPRLEALLHDNGEPDAVVVNSGLGGERTPEGMIRLDDVLAEEHGNVLLLMEGSNDISRQISRETTMFNLAEMARHAENRGYEAVHSTLIPRIPTAAVDDENVLNQRLNQELRDLAGRRGRRLVDNFYAFGAIPDAFATHYWIEPSDHVGHPNAMGYDVMADVFLDVLTGTDSVPPVPGLMSPEHGARRVPATPTIQIDLWDFGAGIDLANTVLTLDGAEVDAQVTGAGQRGQVFYTATEPLAGWVDVGLRTRDLATPPNTFDGRIARFLIAGTTFLTGDLDESGRVDGADLVAFARVFGSSAGSGRFDRDADFDEDGDVDGDDLAMLASNFGLSSF